VQTSLTADYVDALGRVEVPTLILSPSHDVLIGENASTIMLEGIPGAREVVLPRTGHMSPGSPRGRWSSGPDLYRSFPVR
jgi:pimeloyl-ACP methyl ester carboxylesterase